MEFGLTTGTGICRIEPLLERIVADEALPELARELFALHAREYAQLRKEIEKVDDRLMAWHRESECSQRLAQIPGIGPIGASLLMLKTPDPRLFKSGRDFAAWMGLTPRDHSTAGKVRLGAITRAGDEQLRSVLVVGATAVVQHARKAKGRKPAGTERWLTGATVWPAQPCKRRSGCLHRPRSGETWLRSWRRHQPRPAGQSRYTW